MSRRLLTVLLACAAVVALAITVASPASALTLRDCPRMPDFRCGTVTVPLDRSGRVPGTVALKIAVEAPRKGANGFLLALSGGPGQPAVAFAPSFRTSLAPALQHRRLVVLDQRGTGGSGVLSCPPLQALGTLDAVNTRLVESCAKSLGDKRQFYGTTDSALDIDAVRQALGAPKLELMGVSYGTYVAVQYARRFPAAVDGLILDSSIGPDGVDPYFLDTFERLPRILAEQCAGTRCAPATADPLQDLGTLTRRLAAQGPLRGRIPDARGQLRPTAVHDESELLLMIMSGDLNPYLQASLPGAIAAAAHGDAAPLLRLRRYAQGPASPASQFSAALNVATTCSDVTLPYSLLDPIGTRFERWQHGADLVPGSAFAPFSRAAVVATSLAHDCLRWPQGDTPAPPSTAPLPDVPTLLLSGRLDTRTPTENARELKPLLPHAQLLTVAGTGHDVLDSDITGCAARALKRFADGQAIGTPCAGRTNAVPVQARPALRLSQYRHPARVPGDRGRLLYATLDTLVDAQINVVESLFAGFGSTQGGGLRGGRYAVARDGSRMRLVRYALVPGLRVSGTVKLGGSDDTEAGTLTVDGPGRLDGTLRLGARGVVTGTLAGRAVRYAPGRGSAAAAGRGRVPEHVALPSLAAARRAGAALRRSF